MEKRPHSSITNTTSASDSGSPANPSDSGSPANPSDSGSPVNPNLVEDNTWMNRMCVSLLTCGGREENLTVEENVSDVSSTPLIWQPTAPIRVQPPVQSPTGESDQATLLDVSSISQDSVPASMGDKSKRQFRSSDPYLLLSHKGTGYSLLPQMEQQLARPKSVPLLSYEVDKLKLPHQSGEDSEQTTHTVTGSTNPNIEITGSSDVTSFQSVHRNVERTHPHVESANPNIETMGSSDVITFQTVRRNVVNLWNRTRHMKLNRNSIRNFLLTPVKESTSSSTKVRVSDTTKESVNPTIDTSGSSCTVFKKYEQTPDEAGNPLLGKEVSDQQIPKTPMSTPAKHSASVSKLDVPSKSRGSSSKTQDPGVVAGPSGYKPLLGASTDPTLSETSVAGADHSLLAESTGAQSVSSGVELDLITKSTESSVTQQPGAEKAAVEDTSLLVSETSPSEQVLESCTESVSSDDELNSTSTSTESSATTEQTVMLKK